MKLIFLCCLLIAMGTAFGQEGSKKIDLEKYVYDYVQKHTTEPKPKGEFETTEEWEKRVYQEKDEQKRELIHEALYKLYGKPKCALGEYNADNGYFLIETNRFGSYIFYTDRNDARELKEEWEAGIIPFRYQYGLVEGVPRLVDFYKWEWKWERRGDEVYPFDKETGKNYSFFWEDSIWISGQDMYKYRKGYYEPFQSEEVDEQPSFPGDMNEWLKNNLSDETLEIIKHIFSTNNTYRIAEFQEKVTIYAIIETNGEISNVALDPSWVYGKLPPFVRRKLWFSEGYRNNHYEKEALRLVENMPRWNPGKKRNRPAVVHHKIVIEFDTITFEHASFSGNMEKWLKDNLKYPKKGKGKSGTVNVRAIICKDGSLEVKTSVKTYIKEDAPFVKEAIRLVEAMPKWNPAKRCGIPINKLYTIPIRFEP